MYICFMFRI